METTKFHPWWMNVLERTSAESRCARKQEPFWKMADWMFASIFLVDEFRTRKQKMKLEMNTLYLWIRHIKARKCRQKAIFTSLVDKHSSEDSCTPLNILSTYFSWITLSTSYPVLVVSSSFCQYLNSGFVFVLLLVRSDRFVLPLVAAVVDRMGTDKIYPLHHMVSVFKMRKSV